MQTYTQDGRPDPGPNDAASGHESQVSDQLPALMRAEIDSQIATARAFPRSIAKFAREARELVTLDAETAESCIYALPRDGKTIAGPSARFAEILQYCFGNTRGGGRVIDDAGKFVVGQGVFHDLEKNNMVTMEVQRRITNKSGKRFQDDMIGVTGNAASSIAHRNAVLKGIPKAIWLPIYEAARATAIGDARTLVTRRDAAISWFAKVGVSVEMILSKLGVPGIEDIGLDELEILTGLKTALRDGSERAEKLFAPPEKDNPGASLAERIEAARAAQAAAEGAAAPGEIPPPDVDKDTGEILPPELQSHPAHQGKPA
jgi:hypothetical protein